MARLPGGGEHGEGAGEVSLDAGAVSHQSPSLPEGWPSSPGHRRRQACGVMGSPGRCRTAEGPESEKPGHAEPSADPCLVHVLGAASSEPSRPSPGPPRETDPSPRCW